MKDVPETIQRLFLEVTTLTQDYIVGNEGVQRIIQLKQPPLSREDALQILNQERKTFDDPRVYLSEAWFALAFLIYKEIQVYHHAENIYSFIIPVLQSLLLAAMLLYISRILGPIIPGQHTVSKLILPKKQYEKHQRELAFRNARIHVGRIGPLSPWRLLSSNKELETLFDSRKIHVLIHESILLALEGLNGKYKAFDCVGISALLLLKLIESKTEHTIKWLYKPGTDFDGHNTILLNHNGSDIKNVAQWNNDCIMLDGWHGICKTAEQIKAEPDFFSRYPLLSPEDKVLLTTVAPPAHPDYDYYIREMNKAIGSANRLSI